MEQISDALKSIRTNRITEKQKIIDFTKESPLVRTKREIQLEIANAEKYRVAVLKTIVTFAGVTDNFLVSAAQSLTEHYYQKGNVIIRQDDVGDSFYILEEGTVSVTKKVNSRDSAEQSKELAKLHKNSYFGEIALLTEEPRASTVTVISDTAKCLRMTKAKFDEITAESKKITATTRDIIIQNAVDQLGFFKSLPGQAKKKIIESMTVVSYNPGSYVCIQGTVGNTFYILTEGECRVTVNNEDGSEEKELSRIYPGEFFGECTLFKKDYFFVLSLLLPLC